MANSDSNPLTIDDVVTDEVKTNIEAAISQAELNTSGELRVHLENECPENPLDRASFIFSHLGMHKTALRNGVLIYIAVKDRKVAIIGDVGINVHMEKHSWDDIRLDMTNHFRNGDIEKGIVGAVKKVGEKIQMHFPISSDDKNELTNQVSTGNIGRKK